MGAIAQQRRVSKTRKLKRRTHYKLQVPGMPFPIKKIIGYRMNLIDEEIKPLIKLLLTSL